MAAKRPINVTIAGDYNDKDINRAIKDLQSLKNEGDTTSKGMSSFGKSLAAVGATIAATFAAGQIVDFFKSSAEAAMEDQKSMVSLAKAMENVGLSAQNAKVEEFVNNLSLANGVADDLLRPSLQKLITATGDVAQSQSALSLAMDISAGTGKSLDVVTQSLAKGFSGNTGALGRLGAGIDAATLKSKDMDAITGALSAKFSGQAAAAADTYQGKMNRVSVAVGEAKETIGYALIKALDSLVGKLGGTDGVIGAIESFGKGMANLVSVGAQKLQPVLETLKAVFGALYTVITSFALPVLGKLFEMMGSLPTPILAGAAAMVLLQTSGLGAALNSAISGAITWLKGLATTMMAAWTEARTLAAAQVAAGASSSIMATGTAVAGVAVTGLGTALKGVMVSLGPVGIALAVTAAAVAMFTSRSNSGNTATAAWTQSLYDQNGALVANARALAAAGIAKDETLAKSAQFGISTAELTKGLMGNDKALASVKSRLQAIAAYQGEMSGQTAQETDAQLKRARTAQEILDTLNNTESGIATSAAAAKRTTEALKALGIETTTIIPTVKQHGTTVTEVASAYDKLKQSFDEWYKGGLDNLGGKLETAKKAFDDFKNSVRDSITKALDFGAAAQEFDDKGNKVGKSFIEKLTEQAGQATEFAAKVKELIVSGLSKEALTQVLAAGVTAGTSIANELIAGGSGAITATNDLVSSTQAAADEVGLLAADKWFGVGVTSAQKTLDGFESEFGPKGKSRNKIMRVMDSLAASMDRSATITVTTINRIVNQSIPSTVTTYGGADGNPATPFATGGIVTGPTFAMIGEAGPEAVIPLSSPSASNYLSGGGGGSTYNITVQAGVGDPREIGQSIVEYISKFEKANGNVYAKAG